MESKKGLNLGLGRREKIIKGEEDENSIIWVLEIMESKKIINLGLGRRGNWDLGLTAQPFLSLA